MGLKARLLSCILGIMTVPMATVTMATTDSFTSVAFRRLSIKIFFVSLFQKSILNPYRGRIGSSAHMETSVAKPVERCVQDGVFQFLLIFA